MSRLLRRTSSILTAIAVAMAGAAVVLAVGSPPAQAASAFGEQRLLVVLIEHAHNGCPIPSGTPSNVAQCPRNSAAQWQTIFQRDLDSWFRAETYGQTSFRVRVLVNPDSANGWWPAPRSRAEYAQHDAFTQVGSVGRDAGELIVGQALQRGLLSATELAQTNRLIMMDNFHARGGTTYGLGTPITYKPNGKTFTTTHSLIPEAQDDAMALSLAQHELGHQLGLPDLYQRPCTLRPPGTNIRDHRNIDGNDCVGPWDHMALDYWGYPGLGAYSRQRARWLNPSASSPGIKEVSKSFSGTVVLDPINRPAGGTLVLRVPNFPHLAVLQRLLGNPGPYLGFMVECRRRIVNDQGIPAEGALVTYVDPSRSGYAPVTVARPGSSLVHESALSSPGASYVNQTLGVKFTYVGPTASGGCVVDVNKTRKFYPNYVPVGDLATLAAATPAFGGPSSFAGFAGAGIVVNGGSSAPPPTARVDSTRKRAKLQPVVKGRKATISFAYANSGGKKARGGTAVVRVNDPYAITVCGRPSRGRVVARVPLKTLNPGKSATQKVSFVPRSNGPIGVNVRIRGRGTDKVGGGGESAGAAAFTTATSTKKKAEAGRTTFRIRAAKKGCAGPVVANVAPLVQPKGWSMKVKGASRPLAPGSTRKVSVVAKPRVGAKPAAFQVPIAVSAGEALSPANSGVTYGYSSELGTLLGGLDLMLRVGKPGRLPAFVLSGPPSLPPAVSYPSAPPAPGPSTLTLTCPSSADFTVTVHGSLAPPAAGALITMTYRRHEDGATIIHEVVTDVDGKFVDHFSDPRPGWNVRASWAGNATHQPATSNGCDFAQIIT